MSTNVSAGKGTVQSHVINCTQVTTKRHGEHGLIINIVACELAVTLAADSLHLWGC